MAIRLGLAHNFGLTFGLVFCFPQLSCHTLVRTTTVFSQLVRRTGRIRDIRIRDRWSGHISGLENSAGIIRD